MMDDWLAAVMVSLSVAVWVVVMVALLVVA